MSTILEHPDAQALLEQTVVEPATVNSCARRLTAFIQRYLPFFYRDEQRRHADTILRGKLTGLQRKTTEPIARQALQKRRPLQHFVGAGLWSDDAVTDQLRRHVCAKLADPQAVLVLDPSAVAKKGTDSCGVARQWCGSLGKVENCQVGVFLAYAAPRGKALVAARLYLPKDRAADPTHRSQTYVPTDITYQEKWRIGLNLLLGPGRSLPHAWVVGDDEFGRPSALRAELRGEHERYALDVPSNTLIRDLGQWNVLSRQGGRMRVPAWETVAAWADRQPKKRWRYLTVRDGEKGPLRVKALQQWVVAKDVDGGVGMRERLVVIRSVEKTPRTWYVLSNAAKDIPLPAVVRAHGARHRVEELFAEGKGEVGLSHYEVRSWTGWHHHMTLTLLALWFLQLERLELGEKKSGFDGSVDSADVRGIVATAQGEYTCHCQDGERHSASYRGSTDLSLA
jgi:SRSO17 transposase